jgi:hypothetical protein
MGAVFRIFPLIFGIVFVYNLVVFGGIAIGGDAFKGVDGAPNMEALLNSVVFTIPMVSGPWAATWGTVFVTVGLVCLFVEVLRSASSDSIAITNHALSLIVLVLCLIEFVVVKGFNTSVFFYFTMMAMIDVVAGFTVSIISSRRDFGAGGGIIAPH